MFSIFLRRLQKFLPFLRIITAVLAAAALFYLVVFTGPELITILLASVCLGLLAISALSVFVNSRVAFLIGVSLAFVFFLKAEDLLSPLNLGVFIVFIVLLAFYLRPDSPRRTIKKE